MIKTKPSKAKRSTSKQSRKKAVGPPKDGLSISALSEKFDIPDRATVRKRLKGVPPIWVEEKLKLYRLTDTNQDGKTVEELLTADDDTELLELRKRKLLAEAVQIERKNDAAESVSRAEAKQFAFEFLSAMYKRLVKINPRQSAPRLFKAQTVLELQRMMETDADLIFQELKRDYAKQLFEGIASE